MPEQVAVYAFTPSEVAKLIERKVLEIDSAFKEPSFIIIRGILGNLRNDSRYQSYYTTIRDTAGVTVSNVEIPKTLIKDIAAFQHKEVEAGGLLKLRVEKGRDILSFAFSVARIELVKELSEVVVEQEATLSELLKVHLRDLRPFPSQDSYSIAVVHGHTTQVKDEFERQLYLDGNSGEKLKVAYYPTNITSSPHIRQALHNAAGDIIVVMRGGGGAAQFEVFNDFELLKAWVMKDAYKISAIGHSKDRTFFDHFASQSCDTPTHAGIFIRQNIESLRALVKIEEITHKHKKDLENTHKEYAQKIETLNKEKDAALKELQTKSETMQGQFTKAFIEKDATINQLNVSLKEKEGELKNVEQKIELAVKKALSVADGRIIALQTELDTAKKQLKNSQTTMIAIAILAVVIIAVLFLLR